MTNLECAAILFDMDGTLIDSTVAVAGAWRKWALQRGLNPEIVIDGGHGRRTVETIREFAPEMDAEKEAQRIESTEAMSIESVTVVPGAAEVLRDLAPEKWGVVTSATRSMAIARLRDTGLIVPRVLVSADDVINGKPHPEPYLKGAADLGFAPELCVVFEDAPAGILSARAAGMQVIGVLTTYPPEVLQGVSEVIEDFRNVRIEQSHNGILQIILKD